MSIPISTENREKLDAIAEGISPEDYIDAIWFRRDALYTGPRRPRWPWPLRPRANVQVRAPWFDRRTIGLAQPLWKFDA